MSVPEPRVITVGAVEVTTTYGKKPDVTREMGLGRHEQCEHCGETFRTMTWSDKTGKGMQTNVYGHPVTGRVLVEHLQPVRVLTPQGDKVAGYLIHECTKEEE